MVEPLFHHSVTTVLIPHALSLALYGIMFCCTPTHTKKTSDATYAQELLLHATQLFEFGDKHRGIGSHDFYGSSGYKVRRLTD